MSRGPPPPLALSPVLIPAGANHSSRPDGVDSTAGSARRAEVGGSPGVDTAITAAVGAGPRRTPSPDVADSSGASAAARLTSGPVQIQPAQRDRSHLTQAESSQPQHSPVVSGQEMSKSDLITTCTGLDAAPSATARNAATWPGRRRVAWCAARARTHQSTCC